MRVSAKRSVLAAIRTFVADQAAAAGASPTEVGDIIQAVDEAATNIIVHGYRENAGEIEIHVLAQPEKIKITLRDQASVFDPTQVPEPDLTLPLEMRPIGGLGIHLIRNSVDEFIYCPLDSGGNELVLVKYLQVNQTDTGDGFVERLP